MMSSFGTLINRPSSCCRPQRILIRSASGPQSSDAPTNAELDIRARIKAARQYSKTGGTVPAPAPLEPPSAPAAVVAPPLPVLNPPQQTAQNANLDIQARIARARQYKKSPSTATAPFPASPITPAPPSPSPAGQPEQPEASTSAPSQVPFNGDRKLSKSSTPAAWLSGVMSEEADLASQGLDKNMSAEQFTQAKEARKRSVQAEIISVDKTYKPKVSTWGVFPRPDNISQVYGGGRNIVPGQALETPEEKAEREARTKAALLEYKRIVGADIDPEVEAECRRLYDQGEAALKQGSLQAAYDLFEAVTKKTDARTVTGGLATLQKAIVLDSYGYHDEAQKLYRSLTIHPQATIAGKAKRMLFGFDAAQFLKADQIDYSGKKQAWTKYFIKNSRDIYLASPEERQKDEAAANAAAAFALVIMLGPVVAVGFMALSRHAVL